MKVLTLTLFFTSLESRRWDRDDNNGFELLLNFELLMEVE